MPGGSCTPGGNVSDELLPGAERFPGEIVRLEGTMIFPGRVLDIVLLAATETGDPAEILSEGDIFRADDILSADDMAGDLLSWARKVELVPGSTGSNAGDCCWLARGACSCCTRLDDNTVEFPLLILVDAGWLFNRSSTVVSDFLLTV